MYFRPEIDHECSCGRPWEWELPAEGQLQIWSAIRWWTTVRGDQSSQPFSVHGLWAPCSGETGIWGFNIKQDQKRRVFHSSHCFPRFNKCLFIHKKMLKAIQNFYYLLDYHWHNFKWHKDQNGFLQKFQVIQSSSENVWV